MVNKTSQEGSAHIAIVIVLVIALAGILGFLFWHNFTQSPIPQNIITTKTKDKDTATSRDATRKKYAAQFASALFSMYLLQGQTPSSNQQGFDSIAALANDEPITDPSTNQTYVFNSDQTSMKVGEVTFKINSTCDDKISGSNKTGLIIDSSNKSVAVALRLESGAFACGSNL